VVFVLEMHFIVHLFVGIIVGLALHLPSTYLIIFIVASVAIDIDHFLEWRTISRFFRRKSFLFNPVKFNNQANYVTLQKSLHIFHTFEIIILIFFLGAIYYVFYIIGLAFSVHLLFDALGDIINRNVLRKGKTGWLKYWFLAHYIRKGSLYNRENFQ